MSDHSVQAGFKDLFSAQASDFVKYRPSYPPELFEMIARMAAGHERVVDCGTGNGQAAKLSTGRLATTDVVNVSSVQDVNRDDIKSAW